MGLLLLATVASTADAKSPLFDEPFEGLQSILSNGGRAGSNGWPSFSEGIVGHAADFSGSKAACYPAAGNLLLRGGTVEFWIRLPKENHLGLFDLGTLSRPNSWGIFKNRDHVIMEVKDERNRFDQAWTPGPVGHDADWHLVSAVWERDGALTRFKVCWDGECKVTYDGSTEDSHPSLSGEICVGWSGWYGHSESVIDELKIWDHPKSDAEIRADFLRDGPDRVRPVIELNGPNTVVLSIGSSYHELGARASDDRDGDLTHAIVIRGSPETDRSGTYRVSYNVTDAAGNPAREAIRMVYVHDLAQSSSSRAYEYLAERMDHYHDGFDVYSDFLAGGNHGSPSGWMGQYDLLQVAPDWDADCFLGLSCFKNIWETGGLGWAGIRWLQPDNNWGSVAGAGYDLSGATKVGGRVRGAAGGELVEFMAGGVPGDRPDSIQPAASTGPLLLSNEWQYFEIDLAGRDLSHVISPFGWIVRDDAVFYIDEISYDLRRHDSLRLIQSFEIEDPRAEVALANVAYVYDNALALSAFLARGTRDDRRRARIIADTIAFSLKNDRTYTDGRVRNGYMSGDIFDPAPGTAKLPGWWDTDAEAWYEDEFNVSTHTGNVAWAMLAMLSYYESEGGRRYLSAAKRMGNWVAAETWDDRGSGGFTGGFEGWEPSTTHPEGPRKLLYKATEHNIDLYPAFLRLYALTRHPKWLERAEHARGFVDSMWNPVEGHFWTGTLEDGEELNEATVPVDVQPWSVMAMPGETRYRAALDWAEQHCATESDGFRGFDFDCGDGDGVWFEGTAQMALAFGLVGDGARAGAYLRELERAQLAARGANGSALVAASHDGVSTGFDWEYFARRHIGATSWFLLAKRQSNPYWGSRTGAVPVIKINGSARNAVIQELAGMTLTVDLAVSTAAGKDADWWLAMSTRDGRWFYYRHPNQWLEVGTDLSAVRPATQGALTEIRDFRVAGLDDLPPGAYTFYFGVDLVADGELTPESLHYDWIKVDVTEESSRAVEAAR